MHEPVPQSVRPEPAPGIPIVFSGVRRDFRRGVMRGAKLELVTFGFYRFWLATDVRRHLWSNTAVDDDAAEYVGTAKELLLGFLVALAILAPGYLVYFLIGIEAERQRAFASIPFFLFLYLFAQFAFYRARRYRLTRTVWRGVRFSMGGSGLDYMWRAGLWTLLSIVTLGAALPWRQAALERFKMRHTGYGELQGRFVGAGRQLFKAGYGMWITALVTASLVAGFLYFRNSLWGKAPVMLLVLFLFMFAIFAAPMIYAFWRAIEWRWWVNGMRFGDVRFECELDRGDLLDLYWKFLGWLVVLFAGCLAWIALLIAMVFAIAFADGGSAQAFTLAGRHPAVLIGSVFGYLLMGLGLSIVIRVYLVRDVWERIAASTRVHQLAATDGVAARGAAASAIGEGFADSLDIGGF